MKYDITCETRVGAGLVSWLLQQPNTVILSYHPTSSKAYETELIRIPKLGSDGLRTRNRSHIDVVFVSNSTLWLTELKCKLSESDDDIAKLLEIRQDYTLLHLKRLISNRLTTFSPELLENVVDLRLGLGVEVIDTTIRGDFTVFQVYNGQVSTYN